VNVRKVCIDEDLSLISEILGEISLFSYQNKCGRSTTPCKVCCDIPQNKIFWKFNFLGNYSVFGKFEFGKKFPFMEISNFEFVNCNKLL
jgi:hypothetical protein